MLSDTEVGISSREARWRLRRSCNQTLGQRPASRVAGLFSTARQSRITSSRSVSVKALTGGTV